MLCPLSQESVMLPAYLSLVFQVYLTLWNIILPISFFFFFTTTFLLSL